MNNSEFKIGDRVEVVKSFGDTSLPKLGARGTVISESDWDYHASNGFSSGSDNVYIKMDESYNSYGMRREFLALRNDRSGDLKLVSSKNFKAGQAVRILFKDKSCHAEPIDFPYGSKGWIKCENQAAAKIGSPNCWRVVNKAGETGSFHEDFLEPITDGKPGVRVKDRYIGLDELVTTTAEEMSHKPLSFFPNNKAIKSSKSWVESEMEKLRASYPVAPDEVFSYLFGTTGTPVIRKGNDGAPKTSAKKNKRTKRNRYSSAGLKGLKLNKI